MFSVYLLDVEAWSFVRNAVYIYAVRLYVGINDFAVKISGKYNTLIINYKDVMGMISKVTGLIQTENVNIASLVCDRKAKGEEASMCICLDGKINSNIIEQIKQIPDVYFVKNVEKLES